MPVPRCYQTWIEVAPDGSEIVRSATWWDGGKAYPWDPWYTSYYLVFIAPALIVLIFGGALLLATLLP